VTFLLAGIVLASAGWPYAVSQRDAVVNGAQRSTTLEAHQRGDHLEAALLDFGANVGLAAVPTSIIGLTVVGAFPIAAYRAWVGGIVSIDGAHRSRLLNPRSAVYYVVTIVLQVTGFVLTMAAGVHVGLSAWRARRDESVRSIAGWRIPGFALRDAGWLYAVALPIFLAGSLWEFLS
jgi:hypothetical protein